MKKTLKGCIVQAVEIEVEVLKDDLEHDFSNAINNIITAVFIGGGYPATHVHLTVAVLLASHHKDLSKHSEIDTDAFKLVYENTHSMTNLPNGMANIQSSQSSQSSFSFSLAHNHG